VISTIAFLISGQVIADQGFYSLSDISIPGIALPGMM
jgi:hypothetical protein